MPIDGAPNAFAFLQNPNKFIVRNKENSWNQQKKLRSQFLDFIANSFAEMGN